MRGVPRLDVAELEVAGVPARGHVLPVPATVGGAQHRALGAAHPGDLACDRRQAAELRVRAGVRRRATDSPVPRRAGAGDEGGERADQGEDEERGEDAAERTPSWRGSRDHERQPTPGPPGDAGGWGPGLLDPPGASLPGGGLADHGLLGLVDRGDRVAAHRRRVVRPGCTVRTRSTANPSCAGAADAAGVGCRRRWSRGVCAYGAPVVAMTSNSLVDHTSTTTEPGLPASRATWAEAARRRTSRCASAGRYRRPTIASRPSGSPAVYVGEAGAGDVGEPGQEAGVPGGGGQPGGRAVDLRRRVALNENVSPGRTRAPESRADRVGERRTGCCRAPAP